MKISLKQILAVSALAAASTSAFADVATPTAGNGELALVVWDQTTNTSYVRGLQVNLDTIATTAQIAADSGYVAGSTVFNVPALNVAPDANLTAFLASAAPTDTVTWGVIGGAVSGSGNVVGVKRYITTTTQDLVANNSVVTNSKLTTSYSQLATWEGTLNGNIEQSNGTSVADDGKSNNAAFSAGFTSIMASWAGTGVNNQVAVGSAANFYLVSSATGTSPTLARIYSLSALTLSTDGTLTGGASTAATPIPAAFWLLGSGLAGLVGIGRRKNVA